MSNNNPTESGSNPAESNNPPVDDILKAYEGNHEKGVSLLLEALGNTIGELERKLTFQVIKRQPRGLFHVGGDLFVTHTTKEEVRKDGPLLNTLGIIMHHEKGAYEKFSFIFDSRILSIAKGDINPITNRETPRYTLVGLVYDTEGHYRIGYQTEGIQTTFLALEKDGKGWKFQSNYDASMLTQDENAFHYLTRVFSVLKNVVYDTSPIGDKPNPYLRPELIPQITAEYRQEVQPIVSS